MSIPFPIRVGILILICISFIGGYLLLTEPLPQPDAYHKFADRRPLLGLPHMLNVASNLPFLMLIGLSCLSAALGLHLLRVRAS